MLSWQIFPCFRIAIILKRQVHKNTREISVIYSVRSGNPRHMLILGEELKEKKNFIFQQAEKERAICLKITRTLENEIYQSIMNTVATGRSTTYILGQTSQNLKCNIPGGATLITELSRSRDDVNNITSSKNYSGEICNFFSLRSNYLPEELKKACTDTREKNMEEGFCK